MFRLEAAEPEAGEGGGRELQASEEKKVTRVQHFIHTRLMDACIRRRHAIRTPTNRRVAFRDLRCPT